MQTLAVLDVAAGRVVAAGGGDRGAYPPLSLPGGEADPVALAERLLGRPEVDGLYVADLDALGGGRPQSCVRALASRHNGPAAADTWIDTWFDAGLRTAGEVVAAAGRPVIASECWPCPASLMNALVARPDAVFSLDLRGGRLVAGVAWPQDPLAAAALAVNTGVRTLLVLDVQSVGSGGCTTLSLCRQLAAMHPHVRLATGGGLSLAAGEADRLSEAGVSVRLIGTTLHRRVGLATARDQRT